jgi:hypothetical protein
MKRNHMMALAFALALGALPLASGCGAGGPQRIQALGTDRVPAARGEIQVGKTEGAQSVEVDLQHLAPPDRLGQGLSQYAVWVVPPGQAPVLAGFLAYDPATQSGRLQATTPYERFHVLVTAEPESISDRPSDIVVLRSSVP